MLLLGKEKFANVDIRVRVKGGGHVSQMYAVRQAIAKGLVAYTQKYVDEATKKELKTRYCSLTERCWSPIEKNGTEEGGWSWCEIEIPKVVPLIYIYVYERERK